MTVIAIIIIGVLSGMVMFSIFGTSGYIADDKDAPSYKTTTASAERTGKWIATSGNGVTCWYECSECHHAGDLKDKFCRNCGAKMSSDEKCG